MDYGIMPGDDAFSQISNHLFCYGFGCVADVEEPYVYDDFYEASGGTMLMCSCAALEQRRHYKQRSIKKGEPENSP